MWKDFFYFTKSERRAVLVLAAVLVVLSGGNLWLRMERGEALPLSASDSGRIDSFLANVKEKQRVGRKPRQAYQPAVAVTLRPFDPNTADSALLRSLGLPAFIARNVVKYRERGGVFRTPESFSRMYGLTPEQYGELKPYIRIHERFALPERGAALRKESVPLRDSLPYRVIEKYPEGTVVNLNEADTSALKRVPGIGSGLARMIVAYRNRLGGFYAVSQLQEIPYVDASANRWFKVDSVRVRQMEVNRASLDRLRSHPYMDFYKARAIIEYRRKRGKLKSVSQLALFEEFSEDDLKRLEPYLSFE